MKKTILAISIFLAACGSDNAPKIEFPVITDAPETAPISELPPPDVIRQPDPENPENVPPYEDIDGFEVVDGHRVIWGPFKQVRWSSLTVHDRSLLIGIDDQGEFDRGLNLIENYRAQSYDLCTSGRLVHMGDIATRQGDKEEALFYSRLVKECEHWLADAGKV